MLVFKAFSALPAPTPLQSTPFSSLLLPPRTGKIPFCQLKSRFDKHKSTRPFSIYAQNGDTNNNSSNDLLPENGDKEKGKGNSGRPRLNLRWVDLLLDPDPDNIVAVGLTGLLTWASVQVLWQLLIISIAILLAALKYSLVAALLIFILITLL